MQLIERNLILAILFVSFGYLVCVLWVSWLNYLAFHFVFTSSAHNKVTPETRCAH